MTTAWPFIYKGQLNLLSTKALKPSFNIYGPICKESKLIEIKIKQGKNCLLH